MYSSQKTILNTKTISHVYRCSAGTILVIGLRRPAKKDWHASGADYIHHAIGKNDLLMIGFEFRLFYLIDPLPNYVLTIWRVFLLTENRSIFRIW